MLIRGVPSTRFPRRDASELVLGLRTDPDSRFLPRSVGAASRFCNAVERLVAILKPHRCPILKEWHFDVAYSRFEREARYIARLRQIEHAEILCGHAELDPGLLVLEQPLVFPAWGSTLYATNDTAADPADHHAVD